MSPFAQIRAICATRAMLVAQNFPVLPGSSRFFPEESP